MPTNSSLFYPISLSAGLAALDALNSISFSPSISCSMGDRCSSQRVGEQLFGGLVTLEMVAHPIRDFVYLKTNAQYRRVSQSANEFDAPRSRVPWMSASTTSTWLQHESSHGSVRSDADMAYALIAG